MPFYLGEIDIFQLETENRFACFMTSSILSIILIGQKIVKNQNSEFRIGIGMSLTVS